MKSLFNAKILKIFIYIVLCIGILLPCKAYGLDVSIGAATWYAWMEQEYNKAVKYYESDTENKNPEFLIGPALFVKFNDDFNLTFVYLYGKFNVKESYEWPGHGYADYTLKRRDFDLALNYRLNDFFKVFAGIKYMDFSIRFDQHRNSAGQIMSYIAGEIIKRDRSSLGPSLGISAALPILENLFILGHLSGFYLLNKESAEYIPAGAGSNPLSFKPRGNDYGFNSGLSLACYITPVSTTISLGGRYQYIKTHYSDIDPAHGSYYDHDTSKFYGVTLTATYSFSI